MITIIKQVKEIIGQKVYLVGGAVRDNLLNKEIKDWDFCCSLLPDEIEERIRQSKNKNGDFRRCYTIGKRFGTLGFKLDNGNYIEVTSFRSEVYDNNRKPRVVFGSSLKDDLKRRDFTINSIAFDGKDLYDFFGGRIDLLAKKIKTIRKPKQVLKDDPLRMLRAFRFASQLDFKVDEYLEAEIKKYAYKILNISRERWVQEIDKILLSDNCQIGLALLMKNDLFMFMIPELHLQYNFDQKSPYHEHDLWTHTLHVVNNVPKENLDLRWAALLHDVGKPFTQKFRKGNGELPDRMRYIHHDKIGGILVKDICKRLKFSNKRADYVVDVVSNHMKKDAILLEYDKFTNDKPKLDFI